MKGIADTGFLVAFISQNDAYHGWAISMAEQLELQLDALAKRFSDRHPDLADLCFDSNE